MTLPDGGKRTWLFPIVLSLLLHVPVAILLSRLPMIHTYSEPVLNLSLRSIPAAPKMVETSPQTEVPKQRPQPKPQSKQLSENAVIPSDGQKEHTENQNSDASKKGTAEDAAGQGVTGAAASSGVPASQVPSPVPAGPIEASMLKILKQVAPDYPTFSRKRGEEGKVRVIVSIRGGAVMETEIYESSGYPRLDQSALRAARSWRFSEAEELRVIIPFIFSLTD